MKKILLLVVLTTLISANTFSQGPAPKKYAEPPVQDKDFYLGKARKNNTVAWILVGSGTAFLVGGLVLYNNNAYPSGVGLDELNTGPAILCMAVGGAAIVSSIPLFVAGSKNKKKAESLAVNFQGQKVPQLSGSSMALRYVPSLSLKINF
ncbi:MAG: hypothetical protein C5B59_20145 [Bacteroidetes bacterium]|nr:MAG: hypothetical protein C5B59_20145 [Bacteroidota bacterium]